MKITAPFINKFTDITAVDVALNNAIYPQITKIEGSIENALNGFDNKKFDVILMNSVLEHLNDPLLVLKAAFILLNENGVLLLNVPNWRGKFFLEFNAFTLKLGSARYEMNDHKMYYDKKDLWPLLVKAGFLPEHIKLRYHKFGLNLFAVAKKLQKEYV